MERNKYQPTYFETLSGISLDPLRKIIDKDGPRSSIIRKQWLADPSHIEEISKFIRLSHQPLPDHAVKQMLNTVLGPNIGQTQFNKTTRTDHQQILFLAYPILSAIVNNTETTHDQLSMVSNILYDRTVSELFTPDTKFSKEFNFDQAKQIMLLLTSIAGHQNSNDQYLLSTVVSTSDSILRSSLFQNDMLVRLKTYQNMMMSQILIKHPGYEINTRSVYDLMAASLNPKDQKNWRHEDQLTLSNNLIDNLRKVAESQDKLDDKFLVPIQAAVFHPQIALEDQLALFEKAKPLIDRYATPDRINQLWNGELCQIFSFAIPLTHQDNFQQITHDFSILNPEDFKQKYGEEAARSLSGFVNKLTQKFSRYIDPNKPLKFLDKGFVNKPGNMQNLIHYWSKNKETQSQLIDFTLDILGRLGQDDDINSLTALDYEGLHRLQKITDDNST